MALRPNYLPHSPSPPIPPLEEHLELAMVAPSQSRAVAVYCAASLGHQKAFQQAAVSIAHALVASNRPLVYGGGNSGIMGVVSGAAASLEGGKVTGIIPYAIHAAGGEKDKGNGQPRSNSIAELLDEKRHSDVETVRSFLSAALAHVWRTDSSTLINTSFANMFRRDAHQIIVSSMHERKVEMAKRVGAFIGLPGGFGTFEEILEVVTWTQLNIHNKPVILINVYSYYNPLRDLIRNGIREGFIRPENEKLVVFIDGPEDHSLHETFDWGQAAVDAIDAWEHDKVSTLPFHWNKDVDSSDMTHVDVHVPNCKITNGNAPGEKAKTEHIETIPGLSALPGLKLTHGWFKRVWHVRSRSGRI